MSTALATKMKISPIFEIKVAFIGNVSAGKTTVINALFRDKFGEVSMKRTTAGVNEFAISSPTEWALASDDEPRDPKSILKEITEDNQALRKSNQMKVKQFEIELKEALCEMRKDTRLVITDIPGINEAGASNKYRDYVNDNWKTFDCAVVVMDGRQGVNTEEQVSLLHFVKKNIDEKKDVPVVILFNKIDDPEDDEQAELVLEAQRYVEKIFGVKDRQKNIEEMLETGHSTQLSPVFIPISGITAFVFQSCSSMPLKKFRDFDEKLIARLGRERIGKWKWKRLTKEQQIEQAHKAVSDPDGYQQGIEESNFDRFLKSLSIVIGGEATQNRLVEKQIEVSLGSLSSSPGIVDALTLVYKKITALSPDTSEGNPSISSSFWRLYKGLEHNSFQQHGSPDVARVFGPLAEELIKYFKFAGEAGWKKEQTLVNAFFKKLVRKFCEALSPSSGIADELELVYKKIVVLSPISQKSQTITVVKETFKRLYKDHENAIFQQFTSPDAIALLAPLAEELLGYFKFAGKAEWKEEQALLCDSFKHLVRRQIAVVLEKESENLHWVWSPFRHVNLSWDYLSPGDWDTIFCSIQLLSYDKNFCQEFGRELAAIDHLKAQRRLVCKSPKVTFDYDKIGCPSCTTELDFHRHCTRCQWFVRPGPKQKSLCPLCTSHCNLSKDGVCYAGCHRRFFWSPSLSEDPHLVDCPLSSLGSNYLGRKKLDREKLDYNCSKNLGRKKLDYNRHCSDCERFFGLKSCARSCLCEKVNHWSIDGDDIEAPSKKEIKMRYKNGAIVAVGHGQIHFDYLQLKIPASLCDPNHFGHLAWKYCEFMADAQK
jgi:GTPase SAR1 family protein